MRVKPKDQRWRLVAAFRYEEADTLMVLHAWHAPGNHVLDAPWWHWCLYPNAFSQLNLDFEKCYLKKGSGTKTRKIKISMQLGPGIFIRCFIRALIWVNSRRSQAVTTLLPSLVKRCGKQSSFPNRMKGTSELWWVSGCNDECPRRPLKLKIRKHSCGNYTERSVIVGCAEDAIHLGRLPGKSS